MRGFLSACDGIGLPGKEGLMEIPDVAKIVTDLMVRYSFQVLAALAIFAGGLLCARVAGKFIEGTPSRSSTCGDRWRASI